MLTEISLQGDWVLKVIKKEAGYDQRFIVSGSANADNTYPGNVGSPEVEVKGKGQQPWIVRIQHNDGSGWDDSEVRMTAPKRTNGNKITLEIESEDKPGSSDVDFNDCVLQATGYEVDLIKVPFRPYAVRPGTLQMMPDGIFETFLGVYYMAVRIQNTWDQTLPDDSRVRISAEGRTMLNAGGVEVLDNWSNNEQEILGQRISGGWVELGELEPWEMRTVYFKLNCAAASPRKHIVEFELEQNWKSDATNLKIRTDHKIFVSRSSYNHLTKEFECECDQGTLYLKLHEVATDYRTFGDAIQCARDLREALGDPIETRARQLLQDILSGNQVDLCELKQLLDRACEERDDRDRNGDRDRWPCGDMLILPTKFDYRVESNPAYVGQFGPLPFDDPWWKTLLLVLALIFTALSGISAAIDLAYSSDEVVIGSLFSRWFQPEANGPYKGKYLVDAALCELNNNRELPASIPPVQVLDAHSDEEYKKPVYQLGSAITLSGEVMSKKEIADRITNYKTDPSDKAAFEEVRVYKSGARTGLTHAIMVEGHAPLSRNDKDGVVRVFASQIRFEPLDAQHPDATGAIAKKGDSGSIWIHLKSGKLVALHHSSPSDESGSRAHGSYMTDVMDKLKIRFQ